MTAKKAILALTLLPGRERERKKEPRERGKKKRAERKGKE